MKKVMICFIIIMFSAFLFNCDMTNNPDNFFAKTYYITNMSLSVTDLQFQKDKLVYEVTVPNTVTKTDLSITVSKPEVTLRINNLDYTAAQFPLTMPLVNDMNNIEITLCYEKILVSHYKITINKAAPELPAGSLDPSFNQSGKLLIPVSTGDDKPCAVKVQADGKIVIVGTTTLNKTTDFSVCRVNKDGTLDTTFNSKGISIIPIGTGYDYAEAATIQPDGKILIVGRAYNSTKYDFGICRLNSDGTLDTSFNGTGKMILAMSGDESGAYDVVLQSDGKIIVSGNTRVGMSDGNYAVCRLNPNGTLDTTFNGNGIVFVSIPDHIYDYATSIMLQSNGKIILTGSSYNGFNYDLSLCRLNSNGTLDTSFNGGTSLPSGSSTSGIYYHGALQANGKIIVLYTTYSYKGTNYDFGLTRLNTDGIIDNTFNGTGKLTLGIGNLTDLAGDIVIQANGKIIGAGSSIKDNKYYYSIFRLNSNGLLDTTFNTTGTLMIPITTGSDMCNAVALQADGKIIMAGSSYNGSNYDFSICRLIP